ncbi:MAG: hypothetical protein Q9180_004485 [Flavoplaca navasiana]
MTAFGADRRAVLIPTVGFLMLCSPPTRPFLLYLLRFLAEHQFLYWLDYGQYYRCDSSIGYSTAITQLIKLSRQLAVD